MTNKKVNKTISTEQALDMLPYISDLFEKFDMGEIKEIWNGCVDPETNERNTVELGVKTIMYIFKHANVVKDELFNIVSIIDGKDIDEIKSQSLAKTLASIKQLGEDEELVGFIKSLQ